jgi:hypothetical protein
MRSSGIIKIAGPKEAKKAGGLNWDHLSRKLSEEGGREVPRDEIERAGREESALLISSSQLNTIRALELVPDARKRVNEIEAALIIIGAVLTSDSAEGASAAVRDFDWYLQYREFSPGSLGIQASTIQDVERIKSTFRDLLGKAKAEREASELKARDSRGSDYLSNEVVYDFGDGWRVVYVPAKGEMEIFPGHEGSSHDRMLEGNKNGLCLGSGMGLYQDNFQGKIYSVRDSANKPKVTIRIADNSLYEAKGKNNNPPDVESAVHANTWFESLEGFSYQNSKDFRSFPPTSIEKAESEFNQNPDLAYHDRWAPHWYGKGFQKLDEDVDQKFSSNDSLIISAGFGKYPRFFEKTLPVVEHWCNEYSNGNEKAGEVLFGSYHNPPTHEVYKTYKKLGAMKLAVKRLSEEDHINYFRIGLQEIPEYNEFSKGPILTYLNSDPNTFIKKFSDKVWAQPYLDLAEKRFAEVNPRDFLYEFGNREKESPYLSIAAEGRIKESARSFLEIHSRNRWLEKYKPLAIKLVAEEDPFYFIHQFRNNESARPYLDSAVRKLIKSLPSHLLNEYSEEDWMAPYLEETLASLAERDVYRFYKYYEEQDWVIPYLDSIAKNLAEKSPTEFLKYYGEREWTKPYLDLGRRKLSEKNPALLLGEHRNKEWAEEYLDSAAESLAINDPDSFFKFLQNPDEQWATKYLGLAAKSLAKIRPLSLLHRFYEAEWAEPYLDLASKNLIEEYPENFINAFWHKEWAKPYLALALKELSEKDPKYLITNYSHLDWANTPVESLGGKDWIEHAQELVDKAIEKSERKNAKSYYNHKIIRLAKLINDFGLIEGKILLKLIND